jgi:hypothetical protein
VRLLERDVDGRKVALRQDGDRVQVLVPVDGLTEPELFWLIVVAGPAILTTLRAHVAAVEGRGEQVVGSDRQEG